MEKYYERAEPQRDEVETLLRLIDDEILKSRISKRKLERILGQGQGYVGSLIKGRITLKVGHVYDIGEALGLEPLLLFFRSAPKEPGAPAQGARLSGGRRRRRRPLGADDPRRGRGTGAPGHPPGAGAVSHELGARPARPPRLPRASSSSPA